MVGRSYEYEARVHGALVGVVRDVLREAAEKGLPGAHHFYITVATRHPGIVIPDYLRARYPDEMPIVIQHQYWGLEVEEEHFEVTLSFKGVHERLHVPFDAITTFADPSVNFGLRLGVVEPAAGTDAAGEPAEAPAPDGDEPPPEGDGDEQGDKVVSIDSFRKR